jgi:hypothetical protein
MQPVLFDTSIYMALLRGKEDAALQLRQMAVGRGTSASWRSSCFLGGASSVWRVGRPVRFAVFGATLPFVSNNSR